MDERLGEMRKGRRERMRKGAIVSSSPQGMTSIKIWFFKLIECIIKMSWCETECNKTLGRALDPRANGTWLS